MSAKLQRNATWESGVLAFLSRQLKEGVKPIPAGTSFSGQTAIVTGGNAGLGYDCARQLLDLGLSRLILAVRTQSKGDEAAKRLQTQFPSSKVEVYILDMASYVSVQAFAKRCDQLERLDFAILNAGVNLPEFQEAKETKHEMTFQTNYLSTSLLSTLLIPILRAKRGGAEPARLCIVGSDTAYFASWKDPNCKSVFELVDGLANFNGMSTYMVSKLLLLLFVERLCQNVSPEEVIINYVNPGMCHSTSIMGERTPSMQTRIQGRVGKMMGRTPEMGARQYVHGAIAGAESHGSFLSEGTIKPYVSLGEY